VTEILADITGTVWQVHVAIGDAVEVGQTVAILESMKMEIPVESPVGGTIVSVAVRAGDTIRAGDIIAVAN
jgi:acetyl-CoA carboxylase biotin carboxyl carrier protein